MQQRAESRLDATPTDVPLRAALVRAQLARGDGTAARATVNAGLARNPADPALIRLKEALPVPTGSGVLPE